MKFQIFVIEYGQPHIYPPYGAMYIASSLLDEGHDVKIEISKDWNNVALDELAERISRYNPDAIGFSATISIAYSYIKQASKFIREIFPAQKIIVGGGLTSAAEVLLDNTEVDIAVIGEGELTIKELAATIKNHADYANIKGIAFKQDGKVIRNPKRPPIYNLDKLGYPAFELVPMERYFMKIHDYIQAFPSYRNLDKRFFEPRRNTKILRVPTARGCISKCSFCYRHMKGIRHFSLDYLLDFVEFLMEKYNTNQFSFGDECFSSSKKWTRRFIDSLSDRKLDIMFQILGMRIDTVDRQMLFELKELGCWMIEYGFESGSQKMLNVMDKGVSVQDNIDVAIWTREAGIYTSPAFVLGMPGETTDTIKETAEFLKKIGYNYFQSTYAFPVPGTPLYEYAKIKRYIDNEDQYLESISNVIPNNFVDSDIFINFTNEDKATMKKWPGMIEEVIFKSSYTEFIQYYLLKLKYAKKYIKQDGFFNFFYNFAKRKINHFVFKLSELNLQADQKSVKKSLIPADGEKLSNINKRLLSDLGENS